MMTLRLIEQILYRCFSTEDEENAKDKNLIVKVDGKTFKVTDFTVHKDGPIELIVEELATPVPVVLCA